MRNSSVLGNGTRPTGEWSDFVELARRMSVPTDVAIHEFIGRGMHPGPTGREPSREAAAELAALDG